MSTCLQQALPRVVIHRTQVVKKKWKFRVRFSLTKENRVHQTKISTKADKDGLSPAVFRSRLGQKDFRYWMFSLLRLCFVFYGEIYVKNRLLCFRNILFLCTMSSEGCPQSVLQSFVAVDQKLTFDERISCITRLSSRWSNRTENEWVYSHLIQVNLK